MKRVLTKMMINCQEPEPTIILEMPVLNPIN